MIVFLDSDKSNFTTYLNPPIRASKVRLVSCSLYNSWYNLIGGTLPAAPNNIKIPDSHYTPITLAKELSKHGYTLTSGLPHEMTFKKNTGSGSTGFSKGNPLPGFLGIGRTLDGTTAVPVKWKVPNSYEVYCNLVKSYSEGKPSTLMSKFTPKGNPFDLVEYTPISLSYDLSSDLVESIHITIKVDGKTVDFNGRNINLVLSFT